MTGYHEVRVFPIYPERSVPAALPEGWKPFSAYLAFDSSNRIMLNVVARKWNRAEHKEPSEDV